MFRHLAQLDVEAFHRKFGIPIGDMPGLREEALRAELIAEEACETVLAMANGDLAGTIDGLCDLIYVAYGAAVTFGVNLAPFWDAVHLSNMAKEGGRKRGDGKLLKPEGWVPPNIAGILKQEMAK